MVIIDTDKGKSSLRVLTLEEYSPQDLLLEFADSSRRSGAPTLRQRPLGLVGMCKTLSQHP